MALTKILTSGLADSAATAAKVAAGAVVQVVQTSYSSATTTTSQIPSDNTKPQNTEGLEILSQAITPASVANKILCLVAVPFSSNSSIRVAVALFRAGTADALCSREVASTNSNAICFEFFDSPASVASQTYSVRIGNTDAASTVGVCGQSGAASSRLHGGANLAALTLIEVKV